MVVQEILELPDWMKYLLLTAIVGGIVAVPVFSDGINALISAVSSLFGFRINLSDLFIILMLGIPLLVAGWLSSLGK